MNKKSSLNLRAFCANCIFKVVEQGQSLNTVLLASHQLAERDRPLAQEICFGIMRTLPELNFYIHALMDKVLTGKNRILHFLLLVGIYQIIYTRIPAHAAVGETVNAVTSLKKTPLKGLLNGVLREFLRQQDELQQKFKLNDDLKTLHPRWLLNRVKLAYPDQWQAIINANNKKPPMWLRVNQTHYTANQYQQLLTTQGIESIIDPNMPFALKLTIPINVTKLPFFDDGAVTVQDLSAQYAATLLEPQNNEKILDLCAAPGGKTTHILEIAPQAHVLAVDIDPNRIQRIRENLIRLKQKAEVVIGDGLAPENWCNEQVFDRILLDAPCSATGVIRRHPDIKWLRRDSDIEDLSILQYSILTKIWPYLKNNGTLVYATCSILPEENSQQILRFLKEYPDAKLKQEMIQLLPAEDKGDGFFYAIINKSVN